MVFPHVQQETLTDTLFLADAVTLQAGTHTPKAIKALRLFLPEAEVSATADALIRATQEETLGEECYTLQLLQGRVDIRYGDYKGLIRALATLSLLFVKKGTQMYLPEGEITDAPACTHRGAMLDVARGVPSLKELESAILLAAKAKMNVIHLHLFDSKGVAIELDSLPKALHLENAYTKEQVTELIALCDTLALELIPEMDMPAHATGLLTHFPQLQCHGEQEIPWTVCAGNEEIYSLYEALIREVSALFAGSRFFHIGGDELEFNDLTPPRRCLWDTCPVCRAKMEKEGLRDKRELYYYFANYMNRIVKDCGKKTIMWSEQIDCTRPTGLDPDILMQFWRVAHPNRGPVEGCSMQRQLEMGYTIINSYYPNTYADVEKYMSPETLAFWRWDEHPACEEAYKGQILGSEVCLWEFGNKESYAFYERTLPSSLFLMGDKLWSGIKGAYPDETGHLLTRAILGAGTPEGFDIFAAVGSLLPPRSEALCYPEKISASKEELEALLSALEDTTRFAGYEHLIAALRPCVQAALQIKN